MGPYVEDLSTFVANSYSDIEVRGNPCQLSIAVVILMISI
jgi:hypothetical protein